MIPFHDFISAIGDINAQECVHRIRHHFGLRGDCEVHCTAALGGDLRVRARAKGGSGGQNIFTMRWQPRRQRFFCRIYLEPKQLPPLSCFEDIRSAKKTSKREPLLSEFRYKPALLHGSLLNAIDAAIDRWRAR